MIPTLTRHPSFFTLNPTPSILNSASFNFQPDSKGWSLTSKKPFLFPASLLQFQGGRATRRVLEIAKLHHPSLVALGLGLSLAINGHMGASLDYY
jgi:hypothetical protein